MATYTDRYYLRAIRPLNIEGREYPSRAYLTTATGRTKAFHSYSSAAAYRRELDLPPEYLEIAPGDMVRS